SPMVALVERRKTIARPSGETAGVLSPYTGGCGLVRGFISPVSTETTNRASGSRSPGEFVAIRNRASGVQARNGGGREFRISISASLRSAPPKGGTNRTSNFRLPPLPPRTNRTNAIQRPSDDQAGLKSGATSVVSRNGEPDPII